MGNRASCDIAAAEARNHAADSNASGADSNNNNNNIQNGSNDQLKVKSPTTPPPPPPKVKPVKEVKEKVIKITKKSKTNSKPIQMEEIKLRVEQMLTEEVLPKVPVADRVISELRQTPRYRQMLNRPMWRESVQSLRSNDVNFYKVSP